MQLDHILYCLFCNLHILNVAIHYVKEYKFQWKKSLTAIKLLAAVLQFTFMCFHAEKPLTCTFLLSHTWVYNCIYGWSRRGNQSRKLWASFFMYLCFQIYRQPVVECMRLYVQASSDWTPSLQEMKKVHPSLESIYSFFTRSPLFAHFLISIVIIKKLIVIIKNTTNN
jgi:hypothetical protein